MSERPTTSARDRILSRVREALAVPAVRPGPAMEPIGHEQAAATPGLPVLGQDSRQPFLPPVGGSFDEQLVVFKELSERLKTELVSVASLEEAKRLIEHMAKENRWKQIAHHDHPLVSPITQAFESTPDIKLLNTSLRYSKHDLEKCEVGISGCDALIAQTASVLITTVSAGGRALSVLPPHHVVVATRDQMLGTLADAYALLRNRYSAEHWPSFVSLITGPSRTADIERVLVLGAHGPKRLTIILISDLGLTSSSAAER